MGIKADDIREASERLAAEQSGGALALSEAIKNIEALLTMIDDDAAGDDQKAFAKKWIKSCLGSLSSSRQRCMISQQQAVGRVKAMDVMIKHIKATHVSASAKADSLKEASEAIEEGREPSKRPEGMNPGLSIAQERALGIARTSTPPKKASKPKKGKKVA